MCTSTVSAVTTFPVEIYVRQHYGQAQGGPQLGAMEGVGQGGQTPLGGREEDDAGPHGEQILQVQHKLMNSAIKIKLLLPLGGYLATKLP